MKWNNLGLLSLFILGVACKGAPSKPSMQTGGDQPAVSDDQDSGFSGDDAETKAASADSKQVSATLSELKATTVYPRLSHSQWENSVTDLLKLAQKPGLSKAFAADPTSFTFDNFSDALTVTKGLTGDYQSAAETLGLKVGNDQTLYSKLIPSGKTDAKSIVTAFLRNGYRRTPTEAEITDVVAIFNKGKELTGIADAQGAGIAAMVTAVLQSPYFIYKIEEGTKQSGTAVSLSGFEVASRLSYAAWNTMPDNELLTLAASGEILKADVLKAQAKRLLADPRGTATLLRFNILNFGTDAFALPNVDVKSFPESNGVTTEMLKKEGELFLTDIMSQGKGLTEILTASYAFANDKTAAAYEVASPGTVFKKIEMKSSQRVGLLGQVGFLSTYGRSTGINAIIKRGHYVTARILCDIDKGVPTPPTDDPTKTFKTDREKITSITAPGGCAGCHITHINPPGFAMEHLGPAGKYRKTELSGNAIDSGSSYLFSGTEDMMKFDDQVTFMKGLVTRDQPHQCYVSKMIEGMLGRYANVGDGSVVLSLGAESKEGGSVSDIALGILSSNLMTKRIVP